jgi:hypothetical protein
MNRHHLDQIIDSAAAEIRTRRLDDATVRNAADRAWQRIASEQDARADHGAASVQNVAAKQVDHIRGCDDFQALIPAYLSGQLSAARVLLFEDHTRECVPCRKAFKTARAGASASAAVKTAEVSRPRNLWNPSFTKWAVAAALVVGFGLIAVPTGRRFINSVGALNAVVEAANGPVYRVADARTEALNAGQKIQKGERVRTAKGARAVVKLADGSLVEVSERAEFYITEGGDGTTVHLDRGNVIVQAAKQKSGRLFVQTDDALVAVKGTIFSVNSGTKGSRVSVIEGEVHVGHNSKQDVLLPGDQVTTSASLDRTPIQDEVAWSRDAARYVQLLNELAALRKDLNNVARPGVRYSSRLLDLTPEGTVFYAAVPNLSATLAESYRVVEQRIAENPALKDWWQKEGGKSQGHAAGRVFDRIREFGSYLGEEIVLSAELDARGEPDGPLVLAELRDAAGFRNYLADQINQLPADAKDNFKLRLIDDPAAAQASGRDEMLVWLSGDLLAASPKLAALQRLSLTLKAPQANRFRESSFYARIAERYQSGAGLLVAADLEKITPQVVRDGHGNDEDQRNRVVAASRQLGLLNLKHFIAEMKEVGGKGQNSATVSFSEPGQGIASWLAEPGPMGALDLISPDANAVAAFVVNQPTKLVDDLFAALKTVEPNFETHLAEFEREHGLSVREDFAATLGGEFAFAIDGPLLPTPSWKLILEVYDAARLQQTVERVAAEINKYAQRDGKRGVAIERTEQGGRTYYTFKSLDHAAEFSYAFVSGYLIAAPSRALIDRAIQYRDAGQTLVRSPRFVAALPADKQANFSALVYHNLGALVAPLARAGVGANLPEGGQQALKTLADSAPTLAYAYAYGDRIVMSLNTEDGASILNPASWLGLPGSFALQGMLEEASKQEGAASK